jgi:hypothetical protein
MRTPGGGATFRVRLPLEQRSGGDEIDGANETDDHREDRVNGDRVDHAGDHLDNGRGARPGSGNGDNRGESSSNLAGNSGALPKI